MTAHIDIEDTMQADHLSICQEANRQLRAELAALQAAVQRPNPADFASWSQETLAKFAQECSDENKRLRAQTEFIPDALEKILTWANAYPEDIFPEVTPEEWKKARWLLDGGGVSLDRISGSNMRHVITRVKDMFQLEGK